MSSIQDRHAPGVQADSRRRRQEAGECVTVFRKISWLVRTPGGGGVQARSPGDPASAESTRPAPQIAISLRDPASEGSVSVLGITSSVRRAASFAGRGNGGQASPATSTARAPR
jgi:hypothetical protein